MKDIEDSFCAGNNNDIYLFTHIWDMKDIEDSFCAGNNNILHK